MSGNDDNYYAESLDGGIEIWVIYVIVCAGVSLCCLGVLCAGGGFAAIARRCSSRSSKGIVHEKNKPSPQQPLSSLQPETVGTPSEYIYTSRMLFPVAHAVVKEHKQVESRTKP